MAVSESAGPDDSKTVPESWIWWRFGRDTRGLTQPILSKKFQLLIAPRPIIFFSRLIGGRRKSTFWAFFSTKWAGECLILSVFTGTNRDIIIEISQVSPWWARGRTFMADIKTAKLANNFFNFRRGLKLVFALAPHPLKKLSKFQRLPDGLIDTSLNPEIQICSY